MDVLGSFQDSVRYAWAAFLQYGKETMRGKWGDDIMNLMMAGVVGVFILAAVNPQDWKDDTRQRNKAVRRQNRKVLRAIVKAQALYRGHKARGKYDMPDIATKKEK
eukprot:COSAG05_NODE_2245_length_3348_cov_3.885503_4_plen_106_part_00